MIANITDRTVEIYHSLAIKAHEELYPAKSMGLAIKAKKAIDNAASKNELEREKKDRNIC